MDPGRETRPRAGERVGGAAPAEGARVLFVQGTEGAGVRFRTFLETVSGGAIHVGIASARGDLERAARERWTAIALDASLAQRASDLLISARTILAGSHMVDLSDRRGGSGVVPGGAGEWDAAPPPQASVPLDALMRAALPAMRSEALEAEIERLSRRIDDLSRTDPTTGLWGRAHIRERVEEAVVVFQRRQEPFSLCLIELGGLDELEGSYGFEAVERMLGEVGAFLRAQARDADHACRLDRRRFCFLFPATGIELAMIGIERIRDALSEAVFTIGGEHNLSMAVHIGAVELGRHHARARDVLEDAGRALARARAARPGSIVVDMAG